MEAQLTMGQQIWMGHMVNSCDPLTRPLTNDLVNQISRTISITFGIRPIKHATYNNNNKPICNAPDASVTDPEARE